MASVDQYLKLVPAANAFAPKFNAMLSAFVEPLVDSQNLLDNYTLDFDLDYAVGTQLDSVGKWIGLPRSVLIPITDVYFSFNISGLGFNQGIWKGPDQPTDGLITLPDNVYRQMLYVKVMANSWDGSVEQAQAMLSAMFASSPGTIAKYIDNQNMSVTYALSGSPAPEILIKLLQAEYIVIRPAGVRLTGVTIS